jgi:hypothetical protein
MAQFSDIKTRVQYLLKRQAFYDASGNDITQTALGIFVNFALTHLQRAIPVKQALETSWSISIGPGNHPFQTASLTASPTFTPTGGTFRFEYDLWASSAGKGITPAAPLHRYTDIRDYHKDWPDPSLGVVSNTTGAPQGFVIYGNPQAIVLGPYPDTTYTFVLTGVQILPQLVNATDTNWYTLNADDALTYLSCKEAATWLQDDALIALYDKLAQEKVKQVLRLEREMENSEGDLVAQYLG